MREDEPYRVEIARRAVKDIEALTPKLRSKLKDIVFNRIARDPRSGQRLVGELDGYHTVRLTHKDRVVYRIDDGARVVYILRAKTHYAP
jgi:mRNA-degrading endonuclease RelE of RelBE toxin-antitoxin system